VSQLASLRHAAQRDSSPPSLPCDGRRSRMRSTSARARRSSPIARPLCRR
jgi:hypothetical protein